MLYINTQIQIELICIYTCTCKCNNIYIYIYLVAYPCAYVHTYHVQSKHHHHHGPSFTCPCICLEPLSQHLRLGGSDAAADHQAKILTEALGRIRELEMQLKEAGGASEPSSLKRSQPMTPASLAADGSAKPTATATEVWLQSGELV